MTPTLEEIEKLLAQVGLKPCPYCGKNDRLFQPEPSDQYSLVTCMRCLGYGNTSYPSRVQWQNSTCWQLVEWLVKELKEKENKK